MADWTIKINGGTAATLESLGCGQLTARFGNQVVDQCTFRQGGAAFDGTPLLNFLDTVQILKDAAPFFTGVAMNPRRIGTPGDESLGYIVAGPWYYLDRTTYTQTWASWDELQELETTVTLSQVILGSDASGNRITTGAVISDAATQASNSGARYQIGTIAPTMTLPWEWYRDATCAEVIRKMMRWNPDHIAWFDYSTSPPTFNVTKQTAATVSTFTVGTAPLKGVPLLVPLQDQQASGVIIKYEAENDVDGSIYLSHGVDKYPAGANESDLRCVVMTIDLEGLVRSYQRERIVTEAFPTPLADKDWLKEQIPVLAPIANADLTIDSVTREDKGPAKGDTEAAPGTSPGRYVISGQPHEWVEGTWRFETMTVQVTYDLRVTPGDVGTAITHKAIREEFTVDFITTDEVTKTHKKGSTSQIPENPPSGLAEAFYNAVSILQYEGNLVLQADEVDTTPYMGKVVNIDGGATAWETMKALVQTVDLDVDAGTTTLRIGPHKHLSPADFVEWLRLSRVRNSGGGVRTTSESPQTGAIGGGPDPSRGRTGALTRELPNLPTTAGTYLLYYDTTVGAPEWKEITDDLTEDVLLDDIDTSVGLDEIQFGVGRLALPGWLASWTTQPDNTDLAVTDCE